MKTPLKNIMLLLVMLIFIGCGRQVKTAKHLPHTGDTPYQMDSILLTYGSDPERALVMLDSAALLGNVSNYRERYLRATIFSKSLDQQQQDSARSICEALLSDDSVKLNLDNHEDVLNLLMNISRVTYDYNGYLHWATEKEELLRIQDEEVEMLRTEAEIGLVMTHLGQTGEGLAKMDHSIEELDQPGSVNRMDAFVVAVKRKVTALTELGRHAEVIPLEQRVLDRLTHYEQHAADYAEDSYRLSWSDSPSDRDRYLDFSRAQAHGFLAIAYAATGDKQKAREHLAAFDMSGYGKTFSARRMIIPAQMLLGMYDEAMKTSGQMLERMGADTINEVYAIYLRNRALIARQQGQTDETYDLMKRASIVAKALNDSLHRSEAHYYAVRYHVKEQQLQLLQVDNERQKMTIILAAVVALLVVILIAAFFFFRQHRRIVKKNRTLVRMMNENKLQPVEAAAPHGSDAELFATIDATIRGERLYADAHLQRQDICDRFNISRLTLNNLLQQQRSNASLPQYINSIRLEEAVKLLREHPEMTITAVAESVGFSLANFRVQFVNSFGMSPLEYKQSL